MHRYNKHFDQSEAFTAKQMKADKDKTPPKGSLGKFAPRKNNDSSQDAGSSKNNVKEKTQMRLMLPSKLGLKGHIAIFVGLLLCIQTKKSALHMVRLPK